MINCLDQLQISLHLCGCQKVKCLLLLCGYGGRWEGVWGGKAGNPSQVRNDSQVIIAKLNEGVVRFLSHFLTALSYVSFALTFPISYFFCIKTLRPDERMVVFRLGKMIGNLCLLWQQNLSQDEIVFRSEGSRQNTCLSLAWQVTLNNRHGVPSCHQSYNLSIKLVLTLQTWKQEHNRATILTIY